MLIRRVSEFQVMPSKRVRAEEIVNKLRRADVELAGEQGGGRVQAVWGRGRHVLPLAQGVRQEEGRPGELPEDARAGERLAEAELDKSIPR